MASETLSYKYNSQSSITSTKGKENLLLSKFNEVEKGNSPCFFWGKLNNPYELSRCLITLSNTVQSSFNLSPFQLALLKDPIVTAGNNQIRFEGFSHCAGVYARVDVLENGQDGEFIENGTTNVDFNTPLISELGKIKKNDDLVLSVGEKEVGFHKEGDSFIERKVPLPSKWIKGLTTVQHYFSESDYALTLNRIQALQLFKTIPNGKVKTDYFLIKRGNKYLFSPLKSNSAVCIGGIHRLKLLQPLIPLINEMRIYPQKDMQSVTFILCFNDLNFVFSISRDFWRGFSGEGAALESLIEDLPENLIKAFDNYSYTNQTFNPTLMSFEEHIDVSKIDKLATKLSAMGLLGYDLENNGFFYRRLPFKLDRIMSLNPRLKGAEKLLLEGKVEIILKKDNEIEAKVEGSGVQHYVIIKGDTQKCTCTWFSKNQGERGACKHILAVKKKAKDN
ncbi:SWIM zinc finger family protein [Winogradskyella psychrotolerans]|uniref:SWIM zinc finger family protein n=1 Tax=Winogradskyella psychrotolerans TaxID=1344585 RepID=UPI001C067D19|nr:SWIM zinc finger family protein [Winogradskyella psychrotolerans]MBU2927698.1 SWIM zinc finger family protein [Winogradskyella psychrotolerans]